MSRAAVTDQLPEFGLPPLLPIVSILQKQNVWVDGFDLPAFWGTPRRGSTPQACTHRRTQTTYSSKLLRRMVHVSMLLRQYGNCDT